MFKKKHKKKQQNNKKQSFSLKKIANKYVINCFLCRQSNQLNEIAFLTFYDIIPFFVFEKS
jgi:hypothetical protein